MCNTYLNPSYACHYCDQRMTNTQAAYKSPNKPYNYIVAISKKHYVTYLEMQYIFRIHLKAFGHIWSQQIPTNAAKKLHVQHLCIIFLHNLLILSAQHGFWCLSGFPMRPSMTMHAYKLLFINSSGSTTM